MGTRALTTFISRSTDKETGKKKDYKIVTMYRQFDGYPEGHGLELAKFLNDGKMVNGYRDTTEKQFNGIHCLAAQVIAHFKEGVGGFYLYRGGDLNHGEAYRYEVIFNEDTNELTMTCKAFYEKHKEKFVGTTGEFIKLYEKIKQ